MDLESFQKTAPLRYQHSKNFLKKLKKNTPKTLDVAVHKFHNQVFESIDCLSCANCCKTTSPVFYERDIDRLSKTLKIKPGLFIDTYLKVDEEGDYVLQVAPCPFLTAENYCSVYEARPKACRDYPHTDRKKFHQLLDLSLKNTLVCPAVFKIIEHLKSSY